MSEISGVRVAVRIRPHIPQDYIIDLCHSCISVNPNEPQIWLGNDKAFTFDEVYGTTSEQEEIYDKCVKDLVEGCFEGYNATVFAYGQTGSGKTYTMGTGFDVNLHRSEIGIIPRAVEQMFQEIYTRQKTAKLDGKPAPEFKVNAQFIELYNEEVVDLLDTSRDPDDKSKKVQIKIHEDCSGGIHAVGVIAQCVTSVEEALQCLKLGSLSRTTASTRMNSQSSRSHAIYTLVIKQQRTVSPTSHDAGLFNQVNQESNENCIAEYETLSAKFHFVDLAGSERLKRTQATGERQKEGICINSGLLALGNVISALGDKSKKVTHIPYRDSKLTRLLQDSLGGNSHTLMICCVSPSDRDFMETLNTLKYANRAKNIKNKVMVNMDKTSHTIASLRQEIELLKIEVQEYKEGKRIVTDDGSDCLNDMYHENVMLHNEISALKTRVKVLKDTVDCVTAKNTKLMAEKASSQFLSSGDSDSINVASLLEPYILEVEKLSTQLMESEKESSQLRKTLSRISPKLPLSPTFTVPQGTITNSSSTYKLIELAKEEVKQQKKVKEMKLKAEGLIEDENLSDDEKDIDEKNDDSDLDQSDDDNESSFDCEQLTSRIELADLTNDISLKEKLINRLEAQQRRIQNFKQRYEEKIIQLQNKISETERERENSIQNLRGGSAQRKEEKTQRVNQEFDEKLKLLKANVKKYESLKKEHARLLQLNGNYEQKLSKLKTEVADMKRAKVILMNKINDERKKNKELETIKNKEIAQLKKDRNSKDSKIRTLEADNRAKESVLKRKQEEIINLRKINKNNIQKTQQTHRVRNNVFHLRQVKQKWLLLEKKITKIVLNKMGVFKAEKDMEHWLKERSKLCQSLANVTNARDMIKSDPSKQEELYDIMDEYETLTEHINYVNDSLAECQTTIMHLEESRDDPSDFTNLIQCLNFEEGKYLLEKFFNMAIHKCFTCAQQEMTVKELEMLLQQSVHDGKIQEQLLMSVIHQAHQHLVQREAEQNFLEFDRKGDVLNSPSTTDGNLNGETDNKTWHQAEDHTVRDIEDITQEVSNPLVTSQYLQLEAVIEEWAKDDEAEKDMLGSTFDQHDNTRPASLTPTLIESEALPVGAMVVFEDKSHRKQTSSYLICSHVAEGHSQGVVSLECTEDVLFSGSEDGTAKVWDLRTGKISQELGNHPSTVTKVKYCEYTRLAFTSSMSCIKIWDMRLKPSSCIQTLCSSGANLPLNTDMMNYSIPIHENQINDIVLSNYGTLMFSAASRSIRIWDLKSFQPIGTLDAGFQSVVSCLAVDDTKLNKTILISGDTDNSIKIFEVPESFCGTQPAKFSLTPPHYDGIQSLALYGDYLFSGSKDKCIKKWNLRRKCLEVSVSDAYVKGVDTMNVIPSGSLLLSGCNTGYMCLWSTDACKLLERVRAHGKAINSIATNNSCLFTASSDSSIGVWKLRSKNSAVNDEEEYDSY